MKKYLPLIFAPILSALTMYAFATFVAWDGNPAHWEQAARVLVATFWSCGTWFSGLIIAHATGVGR